MIEFLILSNIAFLVIISVYIYDIKIELNEMHHFLTDQDFEKLPDYLNPNDFELDLPEGKSR